MVQIRRHRNERSITSVTVAILSIAVIAVVVSSAYFVVTGRYSPHAVNNVAFSSSWKYVGNVTLSGQLAIKVAGALRLPTPSQPIYSAQEYTKGNSTAYVVTVNVSEVSNMNTVSQTSATVVVIDSSVYCTRGLNVSTVQECPSVIN